MAVTEKEMEKVKAFFEEAREEERLVLINVPEIDVLYHFSEWPCVLRVANGDSIELWACELSDDFQVLGAIQVGTQDEFGRNLWLPGVK